MDNIPLLLVGLGVGLLNLILALVTLGAVARFWLTHHRSGLSTAWWVLSLGFAAFAIAQTLEFRRLLTTTEQLSTTGVEITARFVFVCVLFIGLWRLFDDALKVKQQSLDAAETALRLVRLESDSMRQGREIQLLHKISQLLVSASDLPSGLEVLCRATRDILKSAFVSVRLIQPMPGGFRSTLDAEPKLKLNPDGLGPRADGLFRKVARTAKPAVEDSPTKTPSGLDAKSPFGSLAAFPLLRGKDAIGVLIIGYESSHSLATDEELLVAAVADHAAIAIVNAQLLEHARLAARSDGLTGLANRRQFNEALEAEVRRAVRYNTLLSLLLFDINSLKACNDKYGHAAGDAYLKFTAKRLREQCRNSDIIARIGGDEFAVLMTNTAPEGARQAAERFKQTIRNTTFEWDGRPLQMSISIGHAGWGPGQATKGEALIAAAYQALYVDKMASR